MEPDARGNSARTLSATSSAKGTTTTASTDREKRRTIRDRRGVNNGRIWVRVPNRYTPISPEESKEAVKARTKKKGISPRTADRLVAEREARQLWQTKRVKERVNNYLKDAYMRSVYQDSIWRFRRRVREPEWPSPPVLSRYHEEFKARVKTEEQAKEKLDALIKPILP